MTWIINGSAALLAQSKYDKIIACALATSLLMLITVTLRAYVRLKIVKSMGADDWCILISAVTKPCSTRMQSTYMLPDCIPRLRRRRGRTDSLRFGVAPCAVPSGEPAHEPQSELYKLRSDTRTDMRYS